MNNLTITQKTVDLMFFFSLVFVNQTMACQIGAFLGDDNKNATFPGDGEQGIVNYEEIIQRKIACVKIYKWIIDEFPFGQCLTINNHGREDSPALPYIDIHPSTSTNSGPILRNIINGDYDNYIQSWAKEAKDFGKPLWLCFNGEMNGDWHSGSGAANGGSRTDSYGDPTRPDGPEICIDAWRHIHNIFKEVGADNVGWVWTVNHQDWPAEEWNKFENYYSGDNYVDWLGVDGYNWNRPEYGGWKSFQNVFDTALNRLREINNQKPIMLTEFACAHKGGDKSNWIKDAFNRLKADYPYVKCFIWFHINKEKNWLIDSDGNNASQKALSDPYYSEGNPGTPVLSPDKSINIALNKGVTASSVESAEYEASKAVDGAYNTRWSSNFSDPQWICVDLGSSCNIRKVVLDWEGAYGKSYKIQTSDDNVNWTTDVYSTTSGNGGVDNIPSTATARYVRMYGTERGAEWGDDGKKQIIIDNMDSLEGWKVEVHTGATASLSLVDGYMDKAVRIDYDVGSGEWVQMRKDFDPPLNISSGDLLCFNFLGGGVINHLDIKLVDKDGDTFGKKIDRVTHVPAWVYTTVSYDDFKWWWGNGDKTLDTQNINSIFFAVVKSGGTFGRLTIDNIRYFNSNWRIIPSDYSSVTYNQTAASLAASWIASQQKNSGLVKSWEEETAPNAWLYTQALALIVFSKTNMARADKLAKILADLQNPDGSWYDGYDTNGNPITSNKWVGSVSWVVYALAHYLSKGGIIQCSNIIKKGADWLKSQQTTEGKVHNVTEGNIDAWWAFRVVKGYEAEANALKDYLLRDHLSGGAWHSNQKRWITGTNDASIALDVQTWGASFAKAIGESQRGLEALSFAKLTLAITDFSQKIHGFDGFGPFSIWNEGTLQYVASGGENAQFYLDEMIKQQRPDGALSGSPDDFAGYSVWLSTWHGISPTAWLYFANTGGPFYLRSPYDPSPSPKLDKVVVYPNPYKPNSGLGHNCGIRFGHPREVDKRLPAEATIKIYNIAGELVRTIKEPDDDGVSDGVATWDAKNNNGEKVASGIYIYYIINPAGEKCVGKIGIVK